MTRKKYIRFFLISKSNKKNACVYDTRVIDLKNNRLYTNGYVFVGFDAGEKSHV